MPTEQEELRLTVSLIDNASAGIPPHHWQVWGWGAGTKFSTSPKTKRGAVLVLNGLKSMQPRRKAAITFYL